MLLNYEGVLLFFSVDVIKCLTAEILNSIAEFTRTLENEGFRIQLVGVWSFTA